MQVKSGPSQITSWLMMSSGARIKQQDENEAVGNVCFAASILLFSRFFLSLECIDFTGWYGDCKSQDQI